MKFIKLNSAISGVSEIYCNIEKIHTISEGIKYSESEKDFTRVSFSEGNINVTNTVEEVIDLIAESL